MFTFTIPDGDLRLEYTFALPAELMPADAERVAETPGGAPVYRDTGGNGFVLYKTGAAIRKRPYALPEPEPPEPEQEQTEDETGPLGGVDLTERAGEVALAAGLTAADFEGWEQSGKTGFTVGDVEKIVQSKNPKEG